MAWRLVRGSRVSSWVDEVERDDREGLHFQPFSPRPRASNDAGAESANLPLENLCLHEFAFNLRELKGRFRLHSQELNSALDAFCTDVMCISDAARRRELAKSFMEGIININRLATNKSVSTLAEMQSKFLEIVKEEYDLLRRKLADAEYKAANFERAWQRSEAEKASVDTKARKGIEEEKAKLKKSLQEELLACYICKVNPRNVVIMPCFHGKYCAECLEKQQKINNRCPSCRSIIRGTMPYIA